MMFVFVSAITKNIDEKLTGNCFYTQIVSFYYSGFLKNMEEGAIKTIGKYSYYTQKCLGEGSFGKVFEGFENTTKEKIAVKKVDFKTI